MEVHVKSLAVVTDSTNQALTAHHAIYPVKHATEMDLIDAKHATLLIQYN